jgi:hypothetical protein
MSLDLLIGMVISIVITFSGRYRYHPFSPAISPFRRNQTYDASTNLMTPGSTARFGDQPVFPCIPIIFAT